MRSVLQAIAATPGGSFLLADMLGSQFKQPLFPNPAVKPIDSIETLFQYGTDEPEQLWSECGLEVQRISQLGDADSNFAVLKDSAMQRKVTVAIATHDQQVLGFCDNIIRLRGGKRI